MRRELLTLLNAIVTLMREYDDDKIDNYLEFPLRAVFSEVLSLTKSSAAVPLTGLPREVSEEEPSKRHLMA